MSSDPVLGYVDADRAILADDDIEVYGVRHAPKASAFLSPVP
jgi:hypothetical protein